MKAAEVWHQLGICRVGEQKQQPDRLHHESVGKYHHATTGRHAGKAFDSLAGAIEKLSEGFGARPCDIRGVRALPILVNVWHLLFFVRAVVTSGLKISELLDGPLFDRNIWELLQQGFCCLTRT